VEAAEAAEAADAEPPSPGRRSGALTRRQAINLQRELLKAFEEADFQRQLKALERCRDLDAAHFAKERQELMLGVQRLILPRYGFEASQRGVYQMMSEWGPFLQDPVFRQLTIQTNELLGIDMPPETWEHRVESFRKMVSTWHPQKPRAPGPPGLAGSCLAIAGGHLPGTAAAALRRVTPVTQGTAEVSASMSSTQPPGRPPPFDPWPADQEPPFDLWIAGDWNDFQRDEMRWQDGLFLFSIRVGEEGCTAFQLLIDGKWNMTIYPSVRDATPYEAHSVLGPDNRGHDVNWMIGKADVEEVEPGTCMLIMVMLDTAGVVRLVQWEAYDPG